MKKSDSTTFRTLREHILNMARQSAHVAVALSCVDIIAVLFSDVMDISPRNINTGDHDRFILSKGHGCMALYAVLARNGFLDEKILDSYGENGSILAQHPLAGKVPGIPYASGSLGHGLPYGAGLARALKLGNKTNRVFVLLGDGECDEGTVWEAAAAAAAHKLDNLVAAVDCNGYQACGRCREVSGDQSLAGKWSSFGWEVRETDGHDYEQMRKVFSRASQTNRPVAVICHTVKGKGIDFMENDLEWHYRPVDSAARGKAMRSLKNA